MCSRAERDATRRRIPCAHRNAQDRAGSGDEGQQECALLALALGEGRKAVALILQRPENRRAEERRQQLRAVRPVPSFPLQQLA